MKNPYYCLFQTTLFMLMSLIMTASGGNGTATLTIDFNGCNALNNGNERDYSEFIAQSSDLPDVKLSLVNNNLYRQRADIQPHSCTEGYDGSPAMCVSFAPFCDYLPGSPEAVRFDVRVSPSPGAEVRLSALRFQEQAPSRFKWLGSDVIRLNNYPQYFSVRILREGRIIHEEILNTSRSWNDRLIVLDDAVNEIITEETVLNVEMLAYCPAGFISPHTIWDLDNIEMDVECLSGGTVIDGGMITGGPFEICGNLEDPTYIPNNGITLTGNQGPVQEWIITGAGGNILAVTNDIYSYNLSGLGQGSYLIYHIAHDGTVSNLAIGNSILDITGNLSVSDPLGLSITLVKGGILTGGPFTFCVGDGIADIITEGEIIIDGAIGSSRTWVILDESGRILRTSEKLTNINFDELASGTCNICVISHEGPLTYPSDIALDIQGCYDISSELQIVKENCNNNMVNGGTLTGGPFDICGSLDTPSLIPANGLLLSGNRGPNQEWIITSVSGTIVGITNDLYSYNLNSLGNGSYLIYHLAYDGTLNNLAIGNNILDLAGNYDTSDPTSFTTTLVQGGTLSGGPYTFCVGDGMADLIDVNNITITGAEGSSRTWILIDDTGMILATDANLSNINFDVFPAGNCDLCVISHEGGLTYPTNNIMDIVGCYDISTEMNVTKEDCNGTMVNGGTLTGGPFTFCTNDRESDYLNRGDIILTGSTGIDQWVITNDQGIIVGLPDDFRNFNFNNVGAGDHNIWNLSYSGTLTGLTIGESVNDITGDFGLSNPITINTNTTDGGTLAVDRFVFCVNDGIPDMIPFGALDLTGAIGENSQWVITDLQGLEILALPDSPYDLDFDNDGIGIVALWHLSYTGDIEGLEIGSIFNQISGCYDRSNFASIAKYFVEPSTLTGGPFEICLDLGSGHIPDGTIQSTGGVGTNRFWLVTDADDKIIFVSRDYTEYDFTRSTPGSYKIYQIHYEGNVERIEYNTYLNELVGCLKLSNSLPVTVRFCINERISLSRYIVYPNPSIGSISIANLDDRSLEDDIDQVSIVDRYGRIIPMTSKSFRDRIDIRHLQEGSYFLKIRKQGEVINLPFIKSN